MRCTACGTEHADSARFCGACGAPVLPRCPHCGEGISPGLRFCTACGTSLEPPRQPEATDAREPAAERRRVSVLFVDLEDFTALAETLDPEEVRTVQSRYFETARAVIVRFDGTLEKFIGDAVVAIWGAPVAHEDDAERAVGAAMALVREVGRLGGAAAHPKLTGRASVASGEAAVSVGSVGHGMVAGDLVNVAARLQGHAPSGGVLVDDATRLLAPDVAIYESVGELQLKGRSTPVLAHRARPREAPAAARGIHGGPFVGRDQELRELVGLFDGVVRDGRPRLVSISGIAGIGKSRLVWELFGALGARPEGVAWHAGRAPAYGENITFAAVAEMVRHRIGAQRDTAPELARRQLGASLAELVRDEEERRWLEPRLAALIGEEQLGAFERDELFAAWRRYFERVSEASPAVLVFEDLQWADSALVDFIEHLATWARGHPILVVALTRPELLDRRPTWGGAVGRFTTMHLEPLADSAMRRLIELRAPELDAAVVNRLLAHAGGVPLYAVEFARSLADAGNASGTAHPERVERRAAVRDIGQASPGIAIPDSLHGLIAARIDALPPAERRLLLATAVLGRRFRLRALVALGAEADSVRERVSTLVNRELLAVDESGTDPGDAELAFVQDVVRDVAYRTLSRHRRRSLHLAAARWLEGITDDDVTPGLAAHLVAAHDLAPDHPDATRIARRAVSALRRAAVTALGSHVPQRALGHLEQALRLTDGPEQRAIVLDETASAASAAGRLDLAEQHLRELAALQLDAGERRTAARTRARLASVLLTAQRNEPAVRELEMALRAIRQVGRDAAGVELAAQLARARVLIGDDAAGLSWAERGLRAARRLELDALAADLLVTRGTARVNLGDDAGLDDLRQAVEEAERSGSIGTELRARNNLAWLLAADDPATTLEIAREAVGIASTMGVGDLAAQLAEVACAAALDTGDWAWALEVAEELFHPGTPLANRLNLAATVAAVRALRGDPDPLAALRDGEPPVEGLDDQVSAGIDLARAWVAILAGDLAGGRRDADAAAGSLLGVERLHALALAARACLWAGDRDGSAERLAILDEMPIAGRAADAHRATIRAGVAAMDDPERGARAYRAAAEAWRELGLNGILAVCLVDEARLLGRPAGPETLALLDRLDAAGLRRLLDAEGTSPR